jgi:hypothetical protein
MEKTGGATFSSEHTRSNRSLPRTLTTHLHSAGLLRFGSSRGVWGCYLGRYLTSRWSIRGRTGNASRAKEHQKRSSQKEFPEHPNLTKSGTYD